MRSFSAAERRARLARRHHLVAGDGAPTATSVAADLVALHATDPATPYLSLWARVPGFAVTDLDAHLYDDRSLVKDLAMRRTLWVIRPQDRAAVQSAAGDRVAVDETRKLVADVIKAGIATDGVAWVATACEAVLTYLRATGPCSARELREALPQLTGTYNPAPGRSWGADGHIAPRVLTVLSARGDIVRGPNDGGWTSSRPRWVATQEWLPSRDAGVAHDSARAELVRRWLAAFGPATVTDVRWWFGATLGWARQALAEVGAVEVGLDGTPGFVLPGDDAPEPAVSPWCALLPGLDVTTMGWFDRDWYLGPHRGEVFDRNGNGGPTVWVDGRIVGAWRQDTDGRVELVLLEKLSRDIQQQLTFRAAELTQWLGGRRLSPRFPSPAATSPR